MISYTNLHAHLKCAQLCTTDNRVSAFGVVNSTSTRYYLSALLEPWSFMIGADGEFTTITISLKDIFTSIVRRVGIRH